jgi:hypothetical protein
MYWIYERNIDCILELDKTFPKAVDIAFNKVLKSLEVLLDKSCRVPHRWTFRD